MGEKKHILHIGNVVMSPPPLKKLLNNSSHKKNLQNLDIFFNGRLKNVSLTSSISQASILLSEQAAHLF